MSVYTVEKYTAGALVERDVADTVAGTLVIFNGAGQQQSSRPLTSAELAEYAARDAATTTSTNQATIAANITTHIGQLEAWLTANPNGAVLNAAQTKFVAQTLIGVGRLLLGLTSTVGGAT